MDVLARGSFAVDAPRQFTAVGAGTAEYTRTVQTVDAYSRPILVMHTYRVAELGPPLLLGQLPSRSAIVAGIAGLPSVEDYLRAQKVSDRAYRRHQGR